MGALAGSLLCYSDGRQKRITQLARD